MKRMIELLLAFVILVGAPTLGKAADAESVKLYSGLKQEQTTSSFWMGLPVDAANKMMAAIGAGDNGIDLASLNGGGVGLSPTTVMATMTDSFLTPRVTGVSYKLNGGGVGLGTFETSNRFIFDTVFSNGGGVSLGGYHDR